MGCADVCLDHGYDDTNEFFDQRTVKARKQYSCVECGCSIAPGDAHEYSVGKNEGYMFSERTCLNCTEVRDAFVCGGFIFGMLWDSIRTEIFPRWTEEGPYDCLMKLKTETAREFIRGRYEEWRKDE